MYRRAAESKTEHILKMGPELGELYSALWQELAWIHSKWAEYVALFGTSPGRIDLLNDSAPKFFKTVQDTLWEDVLLHLARLTDSPRSMGKDNLSVRRLSDLKALKTSAVPVGTLVASAVLATEFARDWRNRKLAHGDLSLALGLPVQPLAPASRQAVRDALRALDAILNALSGEFLDSTTRFQSDDADAVALLYVLRDGLRYDMERKERIKTKAYRPGDLKPDPV